MNAGPHYGHAYSQVLTRGRGLGIFWSGLGRFRAQRIGLVRCLCPTMLREVFCFLEDVSSICQGISSCLAVQLVEGRQ